MAEADPVLEGPLRIVAVFSSLFIVLSLTLFAVGEVNAASKDTAAEVAGREAAGTADPSPDQERARERAHGGFRETIDDVNDVLLAPLAFIAEGSSSEWVRRSAPGALALLLYGFGLGWLARFARGRA
jgi:hypothetical protein